MRLLIKNKSFNKTEITVSKSTKKKRNEDNDNLIDKIQITGHENKIYLQHVSVTT